MPGGGSFDWTPQGPALSTLAIPVSVYKYDPEKDGEDRFQYRPNSFAEQIEAKESCVPTACRLSYILDIIAQARGWPASFEQLFPLDSRPSPYAFANDDQVVVLASMPDETTKVLFHGYAQAPQLDLEPGSQHVTFVAYGAAIRCWDNVIDYRRQRNNDALAQDDEAEGEASGEGTYCDLLKPVHFNPLRVGNMIPADAPMETLDNGRDSYPIFTDDALWKYYEDANTAKPALWTLSGFVCYILAVYNDELDVSSPSFQGLVELLDARVPRDDLYDPSDPSTYDANPIVIPDFDVTGMRWPEALAKMLEMHGFAMRFETYLKSDDGGPLIGNKLVVYRRDQAGPQAPKSVFLPPLGTGVDQEYANVGSVHLAWDLMAVRNAVSVEMGIEEAEQTYILAPNFEPDEDEADAPARKIFRKSQLAQASDATRKAYRQYVAIDGNGRYWSYADEEFKRGDPRNGDPLKRLAYYKSDPASKDPVYESPEGSNAFAPTSQTLATKDDKGQIRKAILDIWLPTRPGTDPGRDPGVMGTNITDSGLDDGDWYNVPDGWQLLEDRIGINITAEDPEVFSIDKSNKRIHLISGSTPTDNIGTIGSPTFMFRLTVTTQLPERVPVNVGMRAASPTKFPRWMLVDRQDQYKIQIAEGGGLDLLNDDANSTYPRDDYQAAKDEAVTMRNRHEFPPLAGSITIPELSLAYNVSDRIRGIVGRDISLQCNAGTDDEAPTYPWVVSVTWNFTGPSQTTTLQLSDRRLDTVYIKPPVKRPDTMMDLWKASGMFDKGGPQGGTNAPGRIGQRGQPSGGFTPTEGHGLPRIDATGEGGMGDEQQQQMGNPAYSKKNINASSGPARMDAGNAGKAPPPASAPAASAPAASAPAASAPAASAPAASAPAASAPAPPAHPRIERSQGSKVPPPDISHAIPGLSLARKLFGPGVPDPTNSGGPGGEGQADFGGGSGGKPMRQAPPPPPAPAPPAPARIKRDQNASRPQSNEARGSSLPPTDISHAIPGLSLARKLTDPKVPDPKDSAGPGGEPM